MRFVIITGMSGAGKSTTLKFLEDAGYYCVDNMPIALITKFADLANTQQSDITKVAVGVDIRSGESLPELESVLEQFKAKSFPCEILFLEATDEVLVKRYKETRRAHPLAGADRVDKGISEERKKLEFLKKQADYILDTSQLLTRELKIEIEKIFVNNEQFNSLYVTILSFGFKYVIPSDSDLVFDVRFLPNPYYIPEFKALTGNDKAIQDYVMGLEAAHEFLKKLTDMVNFLIPNYIAEGKNRLVISIGCTGGKHRSVTLANELYRQLSDKDYGLKVEHRDILKDSLRKK